MKQAPRISRNARKMDPTLRGVELLIKKKQRRNNILTCIKRLVVDLFHEKLKIGFELILLCPVIL